MTQELKHKTLEILTFLKRNLDTHRKILNETILEQREEINEEINELDKKEEELQSLEELIK